MKLPVYGDWMPWGDWGPCSETCGNGQRIRKRECDLDKEGDYVEYCQGGDYEMKPCNAYPCRPFEKTCDGWVQRGMEESSDAEIDPLLNGQTSIVHCNLTENNSSFTIVDHDQMDLTEVKGFEDRGSYVAALTYVMEVEAMVALVDASESCYQEVFWQCKGTATWGDDAPDPYLYWLNRDGQVRQYWGGAPPTSQACGCYVNNSCAEEGNKCNCDANDNVLRVDEGRLFYAPDLPMTVFHAGDTGGSHEVGYHQLGPLVCYGQHNEQN